MSDAFRAGMVAIVGRPNVGKSSLVNALLGRKISAVTRKPQTTRHRILGILDQPAAQLVLVDTPGLHKSARKAMNQYMNRVAKSTMKDVDAIVVMAEAGYWSAEDAHILAQAKQIGCPVVLALNKIDKIGNKEALLPELERLSALGPFAALVPLSASKKIGLEGLVAELIGHLPEQEAFFPKGQITDRDDSFIAAELIREQLMKVLHEELPYAATVAIEKMKTARKILHINAVVWVEREGQKGIVIGKDGRQLKLIGTRARESLEKRFSQKVFLGLEVRVAESWSDDPRALRKLGYIE